MLRAILHSEDSERIIGSLDLPTFYASRANLSLSRVPPVFSTIRRSRTLLRRDRAEPDRSMSSSALESTRRDRVRRRIVVASGIFIIFTFQFEISIIARAHIHLQTYKHTCICLFTRPYSYAIRHKTYLHIHTIMYAPRAR